MKNLYYNIFKTHWGWFGLLGNDDGIIRTCLPMTNKEGVKSRLLSDISNAIPSKTAFSGLKKRIQGYYEGKKIDFSRTKVSLEGFTEFQRQVLMTLKTVRYGNKVSYGQLAQMSNNPSTARAIGSVMAKNPMPLIIPCHRVIKADGAIGQFSAPGGVQTKKRMLELEHKGCFST
jgi:methylated-DNA-[protein]-cysteine S-methyltransferase